MVEGRAVVGGVASDVTFPHLVRYTASTSNHIRSIYLSDSLIGSI